MSDGDLIRRDMIRLAVHTKIGVGSCGVECHDVCGSGELLDLISPDPVGAAAIRLAEAYVANQDEAAAISRLLGTPTVEDCLDDVRVMFPRVYETCKALLENAAAYRAARGGSHGR